MSNKWRANFSFFIPPPRPFQSINHAVSIFVSFLFHPSKNIFVSNGNVSGKRTRSGGSSQIPDKPKYVHIICVSILFSQHKFLVRAKKSKGRKQSETIQNLSRYFCFFTSFVTQILYLLQGVGCARNPSQNRMASMMVVAFPPSTAPLGRGTISRW